MAPKKTSTSKSTSTKTDTTKSDTTKSTTKTSTSKSSTKTTTKTKKSEEVEYFQILSEEQLNKQIKEIQDLINKRK